MSYAVIIVKEVETLKYHEYGFTVTNIIETLEEAKEKAKFESMDLINTYVNGKVTDAGLVIEDNSSITTYKVAKTGVDLDEGYIYIMIEPNLISFKMDKESGGYPFYIPSRIPLIVVYPK